MSLQISRKKYCTVLIPSRRRGWAEKYLLRLTGMVNAHWLAENTKGCENSKVTNRTSQIQKKTIDYCVSKITLLLYSSGIDVGLGMNVGPWKFGKIINIGNQNFSSFLHQSRHCRHFFHFFILFKKKNQ